MFSLFLFISKPTYRSSNSYKMVSIQQGKITIPATETLCWNVPSTRTKTSKSNKLWGWVSLVNECQSHHKLHSNRPNQKTWVFAGLYLNRSNSQVHRLWVFKFEVLRIGFTELDCWSTCWTATLLLKEPSSVGCASECSSLQQKASHVINDSPEKVDQARRQVHHCLYVGLIAMKLMVYSNAECDVQMQQKATKLKPLDEASL